MGFVIRSCLERPAAPHTTAPPLRSRCALRVLAQEPGRHEHLRHLRRGEGGAHPQTTEDAGDPAAHGIGGAGAVDVRVCVGVGACAHVCHLLNPPAQQKRQMGGSTMHRHCDPTPVPAGKGYCPRVLHRDASAAQVIRAIGIGLPHPVGVCVCVCVCSSPHDIQATIKAVYSLSYRLPCTRAQAAEHVLHWIQKHAYWDGVKHSSWRLTKKAWD